MLNKNDIPRRNGVPLGRYRLTLAGKNTKFKGCHYVDGVSTAPVEGGALRGQMTAYGRRLVVEPWDDETAQLVADHLRSQGKEEKAALVAPSKSATAPAPPPPKPPEPPPVVEVVEPEHFIQKPPPVVEVVEPELPEPQSEPENIDDLNDMTKAQLKAFAAEVGLEIDGRRGRDYMIEELAYFLDWQ